VNTYVDDADMPKWGQLGCNGLIVIDSSGNIVCRSSPAFMEVREKAFEYVDMLLAALLGQAHAADGPQPGAAVSLSGLVGRSDLNGQEAVVLNGADTNGRCAVQLAGGQVLSIKALNLMPIPAGGGGCGGGGCAGGCDCDGGGCGEGGEGGCSKGGCADGGCVGGKCALPQSGCADGKCALPEPSAKRGKVDEPSAESTAAEAQPSEEVGRKSTVSVDSVKVDALDQEHALCAAALERLARELSPAATRQLLGEYEAHFAHEERLLDAHLYKPQQPSTTPADVGGAAFSADAGARRSHYADHARLLDGVNALLDGRPITLQSVHGLMSEFEVHATKYDGAYAQRLSASLAAAS
jgi:hypothetical protein